MEQQINQLIEAATAAWAAGDYAAAGNITAQLNALIHEEDSNV